MLPDRWIRASALAYSIVVGTGPSEKNDVILLAPEIKYGKEFYKVIFDSTKLKNASKIQDELIKTLNEQNDAPSLVVVHVQTTKFDNPIVVGPIDSHEKLNAYTQYDITFTENHRAVHELNDRKAYSFAKKYPSRRQGNIRMLTWNVFNHREYGYRFLLQTSQHLLHKNHQKKIWETDTLKFDSDQRGRKWNERFQLTNEEISMTKSVFSPVYRVPELMNVIFHSDPTLMCLQEVDVKIWSKYSSLLDEKFGSFKSEEKFYISLKLLAMIVQNAR